MINIKTVRRELLRILFFEDVGILSIFDRKLWVSRFGRESVDMSFHRSFEFRDVNDRKDKDLVSFGVDIFCR